MTKLNIIKAQLLLKCVISAHSKMSHMEPKSPIQDVNDASQNGPRSETSPCERSDNDEKVPDHQSSQKSEQYANNDGQLEIKNQAIIGSSSIINVEKSHSVEKKWIDEQMTQNDEKIAELEKKVNSLQTHFIRSGKNTQAWKFE